MAIPSISQLFRAFEPFVLYQREIEANKTEFQIYSLETFRRKFQILKWIKDKKKERKKEILNLNYIGVVGIRGLLGESRVSLENAKKKKSVWMTKDFLFECVRRERTKGNKIWEKHYKKRIFSNRNDSS